MDISTVGELITRRGQTGVSSHTGYKMAACVSPREPYDYQIEDYEEFLQTYRYNLANIIEVKHAIPWLMHNGILDKQDEETILNVYTTSVLRAGDLIDTVSRRGPRAFNALMEFIEYEYPDIFHKIMKRPPRDPNPKEYTPAWKKQSHVSEVIKNGIELIMKAFDGSITARNRAETSIKDLEEKIQDIECQLEMKREQILEMSQKVIELNTRNKELQTQLTEVKEEKEKACSKQKEICQERDKYRHELQEQKEKLMKGLLQHVKSVNNTADPTLTLSEVSDEDRTHSLTEADDVHKLKNTISKLEKEVCELISDKRCLEEQFDQVADEYDLFRSSVLDQVKSLSAERDQVQHQLEDLQVKYEKLLEQNNSLKENLLTHQSTLRIFKTESSIRRTQSTMKTGLHKKEQGHETSDKCSCMAKDQASNKNHNTERDGTKDQTGENSLLRRVPGNEASKARETRLKGCIMSWKLQEGTSGQNCRAGHS